MQTAIIDYESGNLHSARKAFERIAAETNAGSVVVTSDPDVVARADRIVLPGDGAFPACRDALLASDVYAAMTEAAVARARPFLGICVGMQLMAERGEEYRDTPGLEWVRGSVRRIQPQDTHLKIPHMGWNNLVIDTVHPLLDGIETGDHAYFVHSYQMEMDDPKQRLAHVDYGGNITAIVGQGTMVGTQFHPEKSAATGLRLIANFLRWTP
jgi:imidazole glycerol-phosphate synthase subunit HisH